MWFGVRRPCITRFWLRSDLRWTGERWDCGTDFRGPHGHVDSVAAMEQRWLVHHNNDIAYHTHIQSILQYYYPYYSILYIDHEQFFWGWISRDIGPLLPQMYQNFRQQIIHRCMWSLGHSRLQGRQDLDFDLRVLGAGHHLRSSGNWLIILQNLMVYHHVPIFSYIFLITIGMFLDQISIISSRDRPCRPPGKRPGRRASSPSKANFCWWANTTPPWSLWRPRAPVRNRNRRRRRRPLPLVAMRRLRQKLRPFERRRSRPIEVMIRRNFTWICRVWAEFRTLYDIWICLMLYKGNERSQNPSFRFQYISECKLNRGEWIFHVKPFLHKG